MRGWCTHGAYWGKANTGIFRHHNHIAMECQIGPTSHAIPMHLRHGWDTQIPEAMPAPYRLFHTGNVMANRAGRLRRPALWRGGDIVASTEGTASTTDDHGMDARITLRLLRRLQEFC